MLKQVLAYLALPFLLAGCTISTASNFRVQTATPTNITILTNPTLRKNPAVQRMAQAHCAKYGKRAIWLGSGKVRHGLAPVSFACR